MPPQAGVFSVMPSIFNNGPEAVIIEAVSILSPQQQASAAQGIAPWPLVPAGPVRWTFEITGSAVKGPTSGPSVVGLRLPSRQGVVLGIPLRTTSACYDPNGWTGTDAFPGGT